MKVEGKAKEGIEKDLEKLSLREKFCGVRREWRPPISRYNPAQCGKEAGR